MEYLKSLGNDAKARADTAMAGKKMLDEGGPVVEAYLSAKSNARSAVQADAVTVAQLKDTLVQYKASIAEIEKLLVTDISDDQKAEMSGLMEAFKARLEKVTKIEVDVGPAPGMPKISPVEDDAINILYVKGKCMDAKKRTTDVAHQAMEKLEKPKK